MQEEEQQYESSRDDEAKGGGQGKLRFLLCPLAGRVAFPFLSISHFFNVPALLSFDTCLPAEASTGSRDNNVNDNHTHQHND